MTAAFASLAEPNRRRILDLLGPGELAVGDLVQALDVSQPAVSKHLRVLRDAGLVESRIDAQRRLYRVRTAPLREIDRWLAPWRAMWEASLDALERHLDRSDPPGAPPSGRGVETATTPADSATTGRRA